MNKKERNEKGFTMVELIIVVAIMGIIGALLVPAFGTMSAKARLTTDISTIKTLQRTATAYKTEKELWPGTNASTLVSILVSDGYLQAEPTLQTSAAGGLISVDVAAERIWLDLGAGKTTTFSKALTQIDSQTVTDFVAP
ncbi:type II secretion system protein [Cellulosilyticum sp. ST5]|uniref:type II secretion system protein n=1 Tax=unclassified Cellulosilyticum TaxID=2643091 RepID=UPI000F8E9CE2|nr:type II secretion system protein [Cellulosilyticum sp. WCF-2]QEH68895.1 type II secretion system protein [Cellulosilyticum sp. WCF-2]